MFILTTFRKDKVDQDNTTAHVTIYETFDEAKDYLIRREDVDWVDRDNRLIREKQYVEIKKEYEEYDYTIIVQKIFPKTIIDLTGNEYLPF